jgi:hypothetical protein
MENSIGFELLEQAGIIKTAGVLENRHSKHYLQSESRKLSGYILIKPRLGGNSAR